MSMFAIMTLDVRLRRGYIIGHGRDFAIRSLVDRVLLSELGVSLVHCLG